MDAMKLETKHETEAVTTSFEGEICDLVREVSSRSSHTNVGKEPSGGDIARTIERAGETSISAGATSIEEIEKLIAELQAARSYLQSEGERLRGQLSRYEHLSQTALGSVRGIAQCLGDWRESGHQLHGRPAV